MASVEENWHTSGDSDIANTIIIESHKKFSEGKQVHVGMEASKTNQTGWE